MNILSAIGAAVWQNETVAVTASHEKWLMFFVGVVAVSLFINAIITALAGLAAKKALGEVKDLVADLHSKATPILQKSHALIDELSPKVRTITENATQISYTVREKVDEVGETITQWNRTAADASAKTKGQVEHVNRMVTSTLNTTEEIANNVTNGIKMPVRQVAGWIAGLRTGLDTLVKNYSKKSGPSGKFDF